MHQSWFRCIVVLKLIIMTKQLRYYDLILAGFAAILLISNLAATKLIAIGPFITDGGAILFPLAYIFGDVLTEVYGYKYARRAIWTAFGVMILAVLAFTVVRYMPAAPEYVNQSAYEAVLGFFPRIVVASLAAFLVGSFVNSYVLAKLKVKTAGKYLGVRLIGSTAIGELLDTIVFGLVAFAGILSATDMLVFILVGWVFKTGVEIVLLPVTYRIIAFIKKGEALDRYDTKTDFNPFTTRV
jgi:queuosine precursor transporter